MKKKKTSTSPVLCSLATKPIWGQYLPELSPCCSSTDSNPVCLNVVVPAVFVTNTLTQWLLLCSFRLTRLSVLLSVFVHAPVYAQTQALLRNAGLASASTNKPTGAAPAGVYRRPSYPSHRPITTAP